MSRGHTMRAFAPVLAPRSLRSPLRPLRHLGKSSRPAASGSKASPSRRAVASSSMPTSTRSRSTTASRTRRRVFRSRWPGHPNAVSISRSGRRVVFPVADDGKGAAYLWALDLDTLTGEASLRTAPHQRHSVLWRRDLRGWPVGRVRDGRSERQRPHRGRAPVRDAERWRRGAHDRQRAAHSNSALVARREVHLLRPWARQRARTRPHCRFRRKSGFARTSQRRDRRIAGRSSGRPRRQRPGIPGFRADRRYQGRGGRAVPIHRRRRSPLRLVGERALTTPLLSPSPAGDAQDGVDCRRQREEFSGSEPYAKAPRFSPNGSRLGVIGRIDGRDQFVVFDAKGGQRRVRSDGRSTRAQGLALVPRRLAHRVSRHGSKHASSRTARGRRRNRARVSPRGPRRRVRRQRHALSVALGRQSDRLYHWRNASRPDRGGTASRGPVRFELVDSKPAGREARIEHRRRLPSRQRFARGDRRRLRRTL